MSYQKTAKPKTKENKNFILTRNEMYISRLCAVWLCVQSAATDKDTHNEMTNNYCHEMAFREM